MKRILAFGLAGWLCGMAVASAMSSLIDEPPVAALEGTAIPHPFLAWKVARETVGRHLGFSDFAKSHAPELVRAGFEMPGFAERGELLWEDRHCDGLLSLGIPFTEGLKGVLWVHPRTAKTRWWWCGGGEPREFDYQSELARYPFEKKERIVTFLDSATGKESKQRIVTYSSGGYDLLTRPERVDDEGGDGKDSEFPGWREPTYWEDRTSSEPDRLASGDVRTRQGDVAVATKEDAVRCVHEWLGDESGAEFSEAVFEAKAIPSAWDAEGFCKVGDWLWNVRVVRGGGAAETPVYPEILAEMLVHARSGRVFCLIGPERLMENLNGK